MKPDIERFYRLLAHDSPDAIIYADAEGLIGFWNGSAERMFGFSAAEALGKPLDIIIPEKLRERHWKGFRKTVRTGTSHYGAGDVLAVPALRKDGTRISVEFTILPFRDKAGRTLGMAAMLRDVTKRFEAMKALRAESQHRARTSTAELAFVSDRPDEIRRGSAVRHGPGSAPRARSSR